MKRVWRLCWALLVLAGCTGGTQSGSEDAPSILAQVEAEEERVPEGITVADVFSLEIGQCFNTYQIERDDPELPPEVTTLVDCRRPHDAEVYDFVEHPAGPEVEYPGSIGMEAWATQACYQRFEEFVGVEYERSVLEIGSIRPPRDNWEQGPYRGVHCYVWVPGRQLSGAMGGTQL